MALPRVLAGPIVRRVTSGGVAVWIALRESAQVTLDVYRGPVVLEGGPLPVKEATATTSTIAAAANLHIAVVEARPDAAFTPGTLFAYNLTFAGVDLAAEGLLADGPLANGLPHLALGFTANALPGFRTPPASLSDLRIAQGSCRKPHRRGPDALAELDDRLDPNRPPGPTPLDAPPHMLVLTGDQIYADDVAVCLLPTINQLGQELTGAGGVEPLPVTTPGLPATLDRFPAGLRQNLVAEAAELTSGAASSHLLSFAEFAAMYLVKWSNAVWPSDMPPPTSVNAVRSDDQPDLVKNAIAEGGPALVDQNCQRRQQYCDQLAGVLELRDGLPRVRRALANVATYMMFDDHEVTDDWYLTLDWKRSVLGTALGRTIVRNGLCAYGFFQGWGNDPASFAGGTNGGLLDLAARALTARSGVDLGALDTRLGLIAPFDSQVDWHYQVLDGAWRFGIIALDSRTRRGYRSPQAPPALIAPVAMGDQIPPPVVSEAGREVLFVLASAPVLGVPVIEELFQPGYAMFSNLKHSRDAAGQEHADVEPWSADPAAFEQLLAALAPARRVVFLSGDVHFAHGSALSYWAGAAAQPARFAQFTSSALKNAAEESQKELLRALGFGQRVLRAGSGTARLGWNASDPPPLAFPPAAPLASFPLEVRARFRRGPVLLPAGVWPAGVTAARPPDFAWRLALVRDNRSEAERPADDRPTLPPDLEGPGPFPLTKLPEVARHHAQAVITRGLSRQLMFDHNLGLVSVAVDAGRLTAVHTLLSPSSSPPNAFAAITEHRVALDPDPAEARPALQA